MILDVSELFRAGTYERVWGDNVKKRVRQDHLAHSGLWQLLLDGSTDPDESFHDPTAIPDPHASECIR
jgi:hypothetical protein